jgi:hypothetical protein
MMRLFIKHILLSLLKEVLLLALEKLITLSLLLFQLFFPLFPLLFAAIRARKTAQLFRIRYAELVLTKLTTKSDL